MVAFTAGAVLTAANLNTAFNALTIRTVTGTSDTLVLADNGGAVSFSNASATTSTIPPNSSVAFAVGTKIVLVNLGAGVVTVTAGAGVTVNGSTLTLAQNAGGTCIKTATNTWSFLPFSSGVGAANFSDTATGTYSGYKYKTFLGSGTLDVTTAGFADVVAVGGGGSNGNAFGNGGGAGGVLIGQIYLPVGAYTATIGAGGAGSGQGRATATALFGTNLSIVAVPGGSGNTISAADKSGGSGAGGVITPSPFTAGLAFLIGQGNNGGVGVSNGGGGGGGAGTLGSAGTPGAGGAGGAGTVTSIAGLSPGTVYSAGNYAIGGGGGGAGATTFGAGGTGGGGTGANTVPTAGSVNTGGGAGAAYTSGAAAGGSGILIVGVAV